MSHERLLAAGYAVVDHIDGQEYYGGAAAGMAINGKKCGIDTGLLALFGTEQTSRDYWNYLVSEGVDLTTAMIDSRYRLPRNAISHADRRDGWNDFGLSELYADIKVDWLQVSRFEYIHLASPNPKLAQQLFNRDRFNGSVVSYCPGPKMRISPEQYVSPELISNADIVFFNEEEWQTAKDFLNIALPRDIIRLGVDICIVTEGKRGAAIFYKNDDDISMYRAQPSKKLIAEDSTGAGDAFSLGFLLGQMSGLSNHESADIAISLAEQAIMKKGVLL